MGLPEGEKLGMEPFLVILIAGLIATPFGLVTLPIAGIAYAVSSQVITVLLIYYVTRKRVMASFGKKSIRDEFF